MSPHLPIALGAGAASALLYASLLTGSFGAFILAYLAQLPLFLVGLWAGATAAAIAGGAATLVAAAVGGVVFSGTFLVVNAAPTVFMVRQALLSRPVATGGTEWYPPGLLVAWLAGIITLGFFALSVTVGDGPAGFEGYLRSYLAVAFRELGAARDAAEDVTEAATYLARFFPGIVAASWMIMVAVNSALAQGVLVRFGRNYRPSPAMAEIDLPPWMLPAAAVAALAAFVPGLIGFYGANLVIIAVVPFVLAGLAVVHALSRGWSSRLPLLAVLYVVIFLFGWPVFLLALLGLIEPWAKLRQRGGRRPRT